MHEADGTVFVVDDDAGVRKSLSLSLSRRGYHVESYDSAEAFLGGLDDTKPGCLILDVRMPGLSGLDLQKALADRNVRIPIIFVTGHGDVPMSVEALRGGALDFLEKPFPQETLLARVDEALNRARESAGEAARGSEIRARLALLTAREREVFDLLVAGPADQSSKQSARTLGISHRTVEHHRSRIMEKTGANSLPDLVGMSRYRD